MKRRLLSSVWFYTIAIILALVFTSPLLWLFSTSLKTLSGIAARPIQWIPDPVEWGNYIDAFQKVPFAAYLGNSLTISLIVGVCATISSAFVGFGFARLEGKGKKTLFLILLSMMMMPGILTLIPTYVLFSKINLVNTFWPWFLWSITGTPYLIFLFRQFFANIPAALEEAAIIDGCNYLQIFFKIFLPQATPMLATGFVLSFSWAWGDYISQALLLSNDKWTLAIALASGFTNEQGFVVQNMVAAGTVMYIAPVALIFLLAQRNYKETNTSAGLK